jgi:hypothetical protein
MDSAVIQVYKSNEAAEFAAPLTFPSDCARRGGNEYTLMRISTNKVTTEEIRVLLLFIV